MDLVAKTFERNGVFGPFGIGVLNTPFTFELF